MHVEIWSDIACPWCYVGKRRFEAALAAFEHRDDVTLTWRSFELDPSAPHRVVVQVSGDHSLRTDLQAVAGAVRAWLPGVVGAATLK